MIKQKQNNTINHLLNNQRGVATNQQTQEKHFQRYASATTKTNI